MNKSLESLKNKMAEDSVVHIKDATEREGVYTPPTPLGYPIFDNAIKGGVREGDLIIGTGLSGEGKTLTFQNISVKLSEAGNSCLWFSYEVMIDNLYAKFKEMGCNEKNLKLYAPKKMTTGNLEWVQEKIKEGTEKYGTKFVFIDHIDFLAPTKKLNSSDQKRIVLREICSEIKTMAINLKITIFLIAHVKKVQGRAVEMQDISEASGIYQLADLILAVSRNKVTEKRGEEEVKVPTKYSVLRVLKNRITGEQPMMDFYVDNSIIVPIGDEPVVYFNEKGEERGRETEAEEVKKSFEEFEKNNNQ
jgi:archaellum biogenesis ATPase FlaH